MEENLKLSSRVRYAARAVYYLTMEYGHGAIALHKISDDQNISIKYLENIMRLLTTAGLVRSEKGKNGGFALARPPAEITLNDVMEATEGRFAPAMCIKSPESCDKFDACGVSEAWHSLGKIVTDHLKSVNFQDMMDRQKKRREEGTTEKEDWNYY